MIDWPRSFVGVLAETHLPKRAAAEVVTVDEADGTVRPGKNVDAIVRFLETVATEDLRWSGV